MNRHHHILLLIIKQCTMSVTIIQSFIFSLPFQKDPNVIFFIRIGHLPSPSSVVIQLFKAMSNTPPIFERYPQETVCLSCQQHVVTKLEYRIGVSTWFMCCVVFLVGSFFGCCFLPFCMKEWKDAVHRCPKCNFVIGRKPLI